MVKENGSLQSPAIWTPATIEKAAALKKRYGMDGAYAAGATLLQLQWKNNRPIPHHLISLEQVPELQGVMIEEKKVSIGAMTRLGLLRSSTELHAVLPCIAEAVQSIAAPAIRNRGTIGGNIMGGEGDLIPLLLALNANMLFLDEDGLHEKEINEWLQQRRSTDDKLLMQLTIPVESDTEVFYRKLGRREAFTAAIVTVAGKIEWTEEDRIHSASLAVGGGSNQPTRLEQAEFYLKGKTADMIDWKAVYQFVLAEFSPTTDAFLTGDYKKKVAANLIVSELQRLTSAKAQRKEQVYEV